MEGREDGKAGSGDSWELQCPLTQILLKAPHETLALICVAKAVTRMPPVTLG